MKKLKTIFIVIAISVVIFSLLYAFLLFEGRFILAQKIEQLSNIKTSIGQLIIKPPLNLEIKDLKITGLVNVGYIYLSPSIPSLLFGKLAFNKVRIINPEITFERKPAPVVPVMDSRAPAVVESIPVPEEKEKKQFSFPGIIIKSLKIRSGRLNFTDSTSVSGKIKLVIKDIEFYVTNISTLNASSMSNFFLKGNLPWESGEPDGRILLEGWLDFYKKDMLATLKIENIDGIAFYPYYSTWVDLEKARIDKAKLNFSSNIKGVNNEVSAECHLELADIVRKVRPPEDQQEKAERLTDAVIDMFKAMNNGKVVLDFTLHTKMDRPEFGFGNIKSAFEGKLMQARTASGMRTQDILLLPVKMFESGIKSGADISKSVIDGVFALGNGLKKIIEDTINKQETPAN